MKSINQMAVAAVLALSSAGVASAVAPNVIHVTGSTAYRTADVTAEVNYLNSIAGTGGVKAEYFDTGSSSSLNHAAYSVIYGPVPSSGAQTIFENYFNGSIGGDEALVVPSTLGFPSQSSYSTTASAVVLGSTTTASTGGTSFGSNSGFATETVAPDVAFSDVFFDTATQIISATSDPAEPNTKGTPTDRVVGVVPFVFVANGTTDITSKLSGLTMTPQLFNQLFSNGTLQLSFFTGVTTDSTGIVYALGRDVDSGTRSTALAETGFGLSGSGNTTVNSAVNQFYPFDNTSDATTDQGTLNSTTGVIGDSSGAGTVIGAIAPVPAETIDGYDMAEGDGGYYSGGNLAAAMSSTFNQTATTGKTTFAKTALMTYLGVSDAKTALNSTTYPAKLMSYNGVTFDPTVTTSANESLIYSGKYTFWGYEHEFYFGAGGSAVDTAAAGVQSELNSGFDQIASAGVTIASMQVGRSDDGLAVSFGNPY